MTKELTDRQKQVLGIIMDRISRYGIPPTLDELKDDLGVASKFGIVRHLDALAEKGYITRSNKARDIRILRGTNKAPLSIEDYMPGEEEFQLPLIGIVTAGVPILAEQNIERMITIPKYLIYTKGTCFVLRVQGYSMIRAGIMDGDLVIVRSTNEANNGDIVVALVGNEVTVKRLVKTGSQSYLKAENPQFDDIYPREDWSVQGKVLALIREKVQ
ncbi:transcriptional repressor LexA [candidate division KSB1 bacterium]|nr:transcriptional repressor LexA [candidate division KSB1 bacterium]